MSKYMAVLLLSGILPFLLSFYPPLGFWKNFKALFFSIGIIVIVFGGWDMFAAWRGHWYFDRRGVCGVWLFNLPLEEWLFFVVVPFCCIFTWEALKFIKGKGR
ncbi:MAG: lycopene cyclase domain-containing protein [Candidatus Omnitrophica bacterium]|nr:lycopene cyclase domain-containing protein [Candidatus Omnitrophota bacterium]MDD5042580.1 lycopene cyclase domain-containing protein [Candidatus Omnitrophota bacterium]MDD5501082.1 lycopene cyclase domain-containing protein [Candidatus Omnitrophota bacterium]